MQDIENIRNGPSLYATLLYSDVLDEWIEFHKREIAESTAYNYYRGIIKVKAYFDDVCIQDIDAEMIYEYVKYLKKELTVITSTRLYCKIISMSLKFAQRKRYIYYNPSLDVKMPGRMRAEIYPFSKEEVALLVSQDCSYWVRDAIVIAFYTGMRPGEIFALKWSDINFEQKFIVVQRTLSRASSKMSLKEPKTPTGVRRVDIGFLLIEYLSTIKRIQGNPYVFPANGGSGPRIPWNLSKHIHEMCEKADIPHRTFYALRHTHATVLFEHNVHPKIVQEQLGHSSFVITMDTYTFAAPTIQGPAVKVMDSINIFSLK